MAVTRLGIDGGITRSSFESVTVAIGLATETDSTFSVVGEQNVAQVTRMGLSGGIGNNARNFDDKTQILRRALETDTAISVINPNDVIGVAGLPTESDTARSVSFNANPIITLVSSIRGTNIVTANTVLTVNVAESAGVTSITVNGVATSVVTIITPTEITCQVPLGVLAPYSTSVNVIATNSFGSSTPFVATWEPPFGMVETDFTVDYAGLDPDSPFAGDSNFSALAIGDSCIYSSVTSPDSLGVSMDGAGEFTITGTITQIQTFDYYIYDASDLTVSPTIEQITVQPGPVEALTGQATETDSTFAVSSLDVITQTIGRASEVDSVFSVIDGSGIVGIVGLSTEADSAQPVSAKGPIQQVAIGAPVTTTSQAFPFLDGSFPVGVINQINEVGFAFPVIDAFSVKQIITFASETDTAIDVTFPATFDSIRDQIDALTTLVQAQQLQINDLYTRFDLNTSAPQTYTIDGVTISNDNFILTKSDNLDGTFTINRTEPEF